MKRALAFLALLGVVTVAVVVLAPFSRRSERASPTPAEVEGSTATPVETPPPAGVAPRTRSELAPPPASAPASSTTVVEVEVHDASTGEPIRAVTVVAYCNRVEVARSEVDSAGIARLVLDSGRYAFACAEDSLPHGYVGPAADPSVAASSALASTPEAFAPTLEVESDQPRCSLRLPLFRAARIHGIVIGPTGAPLQGATVRATSVHVGRQSYAYESATGPGGEYERWVAPGAYRLRVVNAPHEAALATTRPAPRTVEVAAGQSVAVDLSFVPGRGRITGYVVDPPLLDGEDEIRWSDLEVRVVPALDPSDVSDAVLPHKLNDTVAVLRTDEDGRFEVEGLRAGRYALSFGRLEFTAIGNLGRIGADIHAIEAIVDEGAHTDLGAVLVPRARPCRILGHVISFLPPGAIEVQVLTPDNSLHSRGRYPARVTLDADRRFEVRIHTSPESTPATVRARPRGAPEWTFARDFFVHPGGDATVEVRLD